MDADDYVNMKPTVEDFTATPCWQAKSIGDAITMAVNRLPEDCRETAVKALTYAIEHPDSYEIIGFRDESGRRHTPVVRVSPSGEISFELHVVLASAYGRFPTPPSVTLEGPDGMEPFSSDKEEGDFIQQLLEKFGGSINVKLPLRKHLG